MTRSPRVAVILKGYPRLSETFIAQELVGLERSGLALDIYSLRHPTDTKRHPVNAELKAHVGYLPEYLHQEPWRVLRAALRAVTEARFWLCLRVFLSDLRRDRTVNRVRRFGQALVLASELPEDTAWLYVHFIHTPGSVGRYAAILRRLPFSVSAHAKDIWTTPKWELRQKLEATAWCVCCTRGNTKYLQSLAPRADIRLLYHGISLDRFLHIARRCGPNGTDPNRPVTILCVARAVPKKGLGTLLEALALLPPRLHWRLEHAGGGPDLRDLMLRAEALKIAANCRWHGAVDQRQVLALMRSSDIFCLSARLAEDGDRDGLPNVLMEALSQALVVVSTDVGGIGELVDQEVGRIVPADDPTSLSGALIELADDPELRMQLGSTGEHRVRSRFSFDQNVGTLVDLFRNSLVA